MSAAALLAGATAFLDRDGTINEAAPEGEYVASPDEIRLLPGAARAIALLNELPARVVVVTNQRGIALGRMSEDDLAAVNRRLLAELESEGAHLDAIYHCPHPAAGCDCRKPGPGMFEQAAREVPGVRLEGAAMVGDSALDVEAGRRLGLTTVRLGTAAAGDPSPTHESPDLLAAARWLLGGAG
ncbi:MAG: HAD family hydrolase [Solirubrobacterales bacterium]|nr:HAD family hydrolase [Solirubrobacterales bacterium]